MATPAKSKTPAKPKKSTSFGSADGYKKKSKKTGSLNKKDSSNKNSKNYKKSYRGQGR